MSRPLQSVLITRPSSLGRTSSPVSGEVRFTSGVGRARFGARWEAQHDWSSNPSIAIGLHGLPVVAWSEWDAQSFSRIYALRWNGLAWTEMNGSASSQGIGSNSTSSPSASMSPDGKPVVAWIDDSSDDGEIYVRRWSGSAWVEVGLGSASGGGISDNSRGSWSPSLAVGPDGNPVVAWVDSSDNDGEIYLRRYAPKLAYVPLAVVLSCWPGPNEIEPNGNGAQANGPLCPGRTYSGAPEERFDVFFLDAAGGHITIEMANHTGTGVQLQLHHEQITPNPMAIDYTAADGYRIQVTNAPVGRYYIVISTAIPNGGATRYTLTPAFTMRD